MIENRTRSWRGTFWVRQEVTKGPTADVKVPALVVEDNDHFYQGDRAHNTGSDEVFGPPMFKYSTKSESCSAELTFANAQFDGVLLEKIFTESPVYR